ncbi:MAG: hypothetical protein RL457_1401 [Pseudomonadota bacterium]
MNTLQNPQSSQGSSQETSRQAFPYRGRFAPSPTGPLHAGSLASALGSWLDARAHGGQWLVRIEDVDTPRTVQGSDQIILQQLIACGLHWDEEVVWQSKRTALYQAALDQLNKDQMTYRCICSRKHIEETLRASGAELGPHEDLIYPGSCRNQNRQEEKAAIRVALPGSCVLQFKDRMKGVQSQDLTTQVGDFVLRRADGLFTYQLSNTARQLYLQQILGYQIPSYLHLPLVTNAAGEKLSKQTQALGINTNTKEATLDALNTAASHLDIWGDALKPLSTIDEWLSIAIKIWQHKGW